LDGGKPKFSYLKAYVKVTLKKFKPYKFLKVIIYFPFLFKLIDPIKKVATSNINEKCYIMMLIIETQMKKEQQFLSFLKLVYFIPVDIIIYPIRVFFSLILWRKTNE
jgi:hypothetical protein